MQSLKAQSEGLKSQGDRCVLTELSRSSSCLKTVLMLRNRTQGPQGILAEASGHLSGGGLSGANRSLLSASGVRTAVPEGCGHWEAVGGDSGTCFGEHLIQGPDSRKTVVLPCENGLAPVRRTLFVLSYSFTLYSVHSFETTSL